MKRWMRNPVAGLRRVSVAALVTLAVLALGIMAVYADKPDENGNHNHHGDEGAEPASIDLITCTNGGIAKWRDGSGNIRTSISYRIVDVSGVGAAAIAAADRGVREWAASNTSGSPYTLTATTSVEADVTIELWFAIAGPVLGFANVPCTDESTGIEGVDISMRTKGLSDTGLQNVSGHEFGHALGLLHADTNEDLMGPRFERKEEGKSITCPSNLDVKGLNEPSLTTVDVADLIVPPSC